MDGKNFFKSLYDGGDRLECVEIPLDMLLGMALEIGELRGRMIAEKEILKAVGEGGKNKRPVHYHE